MIDTARNVFNFAPNIDFRYRFSKVSQLRFMYRGRSSQPSMENLLPIADNSNPLNIRVGNPGLKPAFTHSRCASCYNQHNGSAARNDDTSQLLDHAEQHQQQYGVQRANRRTDHYAQEYQRQLERFRYVRIQYGVEEQEVYGKLFFATQIQ